MRRFCDKDNNRSNKKKIERPRKLSDRSMKLFKKYVSDNFIDLLDTIVAKFNENSGLEISETSGRRYIRKLKLKNCVAIQKPFLPSRNIETFFMRARTHQNWTLKQRA